MEKSKTVLLAMSMILFASLGAAAPADVVWPQQWKVFLPVEREAPPLSRETLATIPERIVVEGQTVEGRWVEAQGADEIAGRAVAFDDVQMDFAPLFGEVRSGNTAYAFLPIESAEGGTAELGMGADWWMQAWLNGELIMDTTETGNSSWPPTIADYVANVNLRRGRNVLAVRFVSGSGSSVLALGGPHHLAAVKEADILEHVFPPGPDPVQGLDAFMERHGHKPYDLYEEDGGLRTLRVIFQDRQFGTQVWMLDNSPTVDHCRTASVWSAWNVNGTALWVEGTRPLGDGTQRGWFFNADFSRMVPARAGRPGVWSPEDPDVFYGPSSPWNNVTRSNWLTGEREVIAEWEALRWPNAGKRVYGMTTDSRHIFVDLPNRGIFVPFERDEDYPIPIIPLYDGRPMGPGPESIGSNHFTVIYDHEEHGDMIALRTGMMIDRETGEKTYVAAPLCGNENYLRAFRDNRVKYPQGEEWNAYGLPWFAEGEVVLPTGLDMDELYALWRNIPHATHGHESHSPDWQYIATDGGTTRIDRVRDNKTRMMRLSPNGSNYHLHWRNHPRYFVAWVRGWHFGSFRRPTNANIEFQVFCDTTAQPIVDTKHRFNGYYAGGDFSMFSPDATKIHYGSSMTGRFRNYIAVAARPRPPQSLSGGAVRPDGGPVALAWTPSAYSRETRGYLVYRGEQSGGPYQLMTPEPIEGTAWLDEDPQDPGRPSFYVVTSLEHSGLESGYSEELPVGADAPLVIYAEAEDAVRDLPTGDMPGLSMGADRFAASDWYYLYRHPEMDRGEAELPALVRRDGLYHIWARVRSENGGATQWQASILGRPLKVEADASEWTWVRAKGGPVPLFAGRIQIALATSDAEAQMDLICLATDASFVPQGPRPEYSAPPPALANLRAENVLERANRLVWDEVEDPAFSHYQVYASREAGFEIGQETLVGSPTYGEFLDWGLQAGARYHYAVTAVNRRGEESAPVRAEASTPPRPAPQVKIELPFAEAELEGPFERSEAGGLRGPAFLVPQDPGNNRVAWRVEIPREGTYYFWLRHLRRGTGSRGDDVEQNVRVRANGRHVTTLGGGMTDLNVRDELIAKHHPMAPRLWTWAWPGVADLERVELPAGEVELTLDRFPEGILYDALVITDEPSYVPQDGRLRQR